MYDVIIVGAGVAGLGVGWQLARRDLDVLVIDRDEPGAGASTAAAGMLAAVSEAHFEEERLVDLALDSQRLWPRFVEELEADADTSVDYRDDGTLIVSLDRDDLEAMDRMHGFYRELELEAHRLSTAELKEREPALSPTVQGGVFCPDDHQVDPVRLVAALEAALVARGGRCQTNSEVVEIFREDGASRGVTLASGQTLKARNVVVAAGAWTREVGGLGDDVPHVRPVRGQMLSIDLGEPPIIRHVIRAPDAYLSPKSDGRLIVGSTMEEVGYREGLTAGGVFEMLRGTWEVLPGVYDLELLDMWSGFRPMTLDNEPVMRASEAVENLWFCTGHGRNGILLAPLTAYRMAVLVAPG